MAALRFPHHVHRVLPVFLFTGIITLLLPALASAQAPISSGVERRPAAGLARRRLSSVHSCSEREWCAS